MAMKGVFMLGLMFFLALQYIWAAPSYERDAEDYKDVLFDVLTKRLLRDGDALKSRSRETEQAKRRVCRTNQYFDGWKCVNSGK